MADHDSDIPKGTPRAVPDPHRDEPDPAPDAHTRPGPDSDAVRPDQQEELGPIEGLMHTSAVQATAEATGSTDAKAEADRLGVEGEGVESAQIFGLMVATIVTLAAAVIGVFVLVGYFADGQTVERDAVTLYPELREVQRVGDEMQNYSRTDSLYRLPIGAAMSQVGGEYYAQQQGGSAVATPANFNMVYLDAARKSERVAWESESDMLGSDSLSRGAGTVPTPGVEPEADTESEASNVQTETGITPAPVDETPPDSNEPEDR